MNKKIKSEQWINDFVVNSSYTNSIIVVIMKFNFQRWFIFFNWISTFLKACFIWCIHSNLNSFIMIESRGNSWYQHQRIRHPERLSHIHETYSLLRLWKHFSQKNSFLEIWSSFSRKKSQGKCEWKMWIMIWSETRASFSKYIIS